MRATCICHNWAIGVIRLEGKVIRLPYAGILQDNIVFRDGCINSVTWIPCCFCYVVSFNPVTDSVVEIDSLIRILADCVSLNGVPDALA